MARLVVSIIAMGIVALPGCSRGSGGAATDSVDPTWERLLTLGRAYKQFNSESRKPPKRASDLRPILKALGVGEETFSSQRDGQPFVICWGVDVTVPCNGPSRVRSLPMKDKGNSKAGTYSRPLPTSSS